MHPPEPTLEEDGLGGRQRPGPRVRSRKIFIPNGRGRLLPGRAPDQGMPAPKHTAVGVLRGRCGLASAPGGPLLVPTWR